MGLIRFNELEMAARSVLELLTGSSQSSVAVITGFPVQGRIETDGIIGSLALLELIKQVNDDVSLSLIMEREHYEIGKKLADEALDSKISVITVDTFLDQLHKDLDLLVSVEYPGSNLAGACHNMRGMNISSFVHLPEDVLDFAKMSIGIGDGGNELGMGAVAQATRDVIPYGKKCACGCGGGIAAAWRADFTLLSGCSNFGAYALGLLLAKLGGVQITKKSWIAKQSRLVRRLIQLGGIEGITQSYMVGVDGIHVSMLEEDLWHLFDILGL